MQYKDTGTFLRERRKEMGITIRHMAEIVECAPSVIVDVETHRRYPLDVRRMDRWADGLHLSKEERHFMYDMIGIDRSALAPDLTDYIKSHQYVIDGIRAARDYGAEDADWNRFIAFLEFRGMARKQ